MVIFKLLWFVHFWKMIKKCSTNHGNLQERRVVSSITLSLSIRFSLILRNKFIAKIKSTQLGMIKVALVISIVLQDGYFSVITQDVIDIIIFC